MKNTKRTERHFYEGAQNWHEHDLKTVQQFYDGTQNRYEKWKKLNDTSMTEHKTDTNVTKNEKYKKNWTILPRRNEHDWKTEQQFYDGTQNRYEKYKKLNDTSVTEHKTDKNITNIEKYEKTEHDGTQNRHEHY